ncbi:Uncharacterized protein PBTT_05587 [Plasmodiophora brassicae]
MAITCVVAEPRALRHRKASPPAVNPTVIPTRKPTSQTLILPSRNSRRRRASSATTTFQGAPSPAVASVHTRSRKRFVAQQADDQDEHGPVSFGANGGASLQRLDRQGSAQMRDNLCASVCSDPNTSDACRKCKSRQAAVKSGSLRPEGFLKRNVG